MVRVVPKEQLTNKSETLYSLLDRENIDPSLIVKIEERETEYHVHYYPTPDSTNEGASQSDKILLKG